MILKNGKRIDGCTDTLPVGTVQPFLGLTPPLGYLVCQGQLISKKEYPELYNICKSTFGTETETHFYLPDLRGKTIIGYDQNDNLFNIMGKILGSRAHTHTSAEHAHDIDGHTHTSAAHTHSVAGHTHTSAAHTHTTGNHTLTVAEMPSHTHAMYGGANTGGSYEGTDSFASGFSTFRCIEQGTYATGGGGAHNHGNTGSTTPGNTGSTSLTTNSTTPENTGSTNLITRNATPGNTGESDNFQPSITMNWIVKAAMLIPHYFVVENTLTSTNASNALSAAQGKILNDSKFATSGGVISGQTKVEVNGVTGATEVPIWSNAQLLIGATLKDGAITRCPSIGFVEYQNADGVLYMKDRALFWASSNNNMGHIPAANTGYEIIHTGNKYDVIGVNWTNGKEVRTLDSIDGKPIYKKYVEGNFNGTTNVTLATGVDKYLDAQITVLRESATQWHRANAHVMPTLGSAEAPAHIDSIFQQGSTIKTYCTNTEFTTAAFRGFIYYTKL